MFKHIQMSSSFQNHFVTHSCIEWQVNIETQCTLDFKEENIELFFYGPMTLFSPSKAFKAIDETKKMRQWLRFKTQRNLNVHMSSL